MVSTQERRHTLIGFARILILKDSMLDNFIQQFQQQLSEQQQQHQQPVQEKRKFLTIAVRIYVLWHQPIQFNPIIHHIIFKWSSNEIISLGDPKNSKALNIKDGVTVACTGNTCDLRCPAGLKPSFNRQLKCVVTKRRKELFEKARSLQRKLPEASDQHFDRFQYKSKRFLFNILKTWQPKKIKKGVHCISDGSNKNPSNPVTPSGSSSGGGFGGGANNAAAWADIAPEGKA